MSWAHLYEAVQSHDGKISTKWLREKAIKFSSITRVQEQWTSVLDETALRGFYVEGPLGPPVPLKDNESLIVLARSLEKKAWRRFIYTKELMHVFDLPEEKADTPEKLQNQAQEVNDPQAEPSPQVRAEAKAYWRALAVLCPEWKRLEYAEQLQQETASLEVVSAALRIPKGFARDLFRDDFLEIIHRLLQE